MYSNFWLRPGIVFTVTLAVLYLLVWITDTRILNADFFQRTMPTDGFDWSTALLSSSSPFKMLLYTGVALILFIKYLIISLLIYSTLYLGASAVNYRAVLQAVCLAELVFLLPAVIKVMWFIYHPPSDLDEWTQFYPLSVHSVVGGLLTSDVILYLLQVLNLFELLYVLTLAILLHRIISRSFDFALKTVLRAYLPALAFWLLIVTYYQLMLHAN